MKKYFLVIAFIVLLVFITVPASADGDLHHYDIYSEDTTAHQHVPHIRVQEQQMFKCVQERVIPFREDYQMFKK
jgi:hypothetical protein